MLLERVLSKLTSFATYSDTPNPLEESVLEEDSDASVFSEDEEYEENSLPVHNSVNTISHVSKGKKRARASGESGDSTSNGDASGSESPSKRVKLEIDTSPASPSSVSRPVKKEVRFHPDTLDNWRWADRDLYTLRQNLLLPMASSHPGPDPLPKLTPSPVQMPLVATSDPKPLSSTNLSTFLESDRDISGHLGAELPPSCEGHSYRDSPEYHSTCAVQGGDSPTPSLCGEIDPPSRSPSPDSRRQAWADGRDGVWDAFEDEEELLDMTLKGAPTPLSSPTLPSHPIGRSTSTSSTNNNVSSHTSTHHATTASKALSPSEVAALLSQIRRLDRATQALVEKYAQHRSQDAWRAGFQVGIHTQLTAVALAAAAQEDNRARLLGLSATKGEDVAQSVSGPSQSDLTSVDKKILETSKKREKKKRRWTVIGKEEILKNQRGWAAIDAAKYARVRSRGHGVAPATVPAKKTAPPPTFVQGQLSDLEGDFEEEELPAPTMTRPKYRLPE